MPALTLLILSDLLNLECLNLVLWAPLYSCICLTSLDRVVGFTSIGCLQRCINVLISCPSIVIVWTVASKADHLFLHIFTPIELGDS